MSKLFFDHLIVFEEIESEIDKSAKSPEEREELWGIVDEIVNHRVMAAILDKLPKKHHEEFLDMFHKAPHDEALFDYLKEKVGENVEELIKGEIGDLAYELLEEIRGKEGQKVSGEKK